MQINANFDETVIINAEQMQWQKSPSPGVHRVMLDRIGEEKARATSLVRYAPGSHFDSHQHPAGEEILVLEGDFNDEHGSYPAGTYLRNPDGTSHSPFSNNGCVLWVKLRQFQADDQVQARLDTLSTVWSSLAENIVRLPLHRHNEEKVQLLELQAGSKLPICPEKGGHELVVLGGALEHKQTKLLPYSWLRFASHAHDELTALELTKLYWKSGHLP
ncbi:cupin domain-containing protein [Corallincola platygyrae]|uniref:Cupin domain-containing protein n=1 Tax=Corallincola platygyrae TaxID=1193278 RepID=A0ABW4XR70_9GAMM